MTDAKTTPTDKAEPVAWQWKDCGIDFMARADQPHPHYAQPLYTYPQPTVSVGLDREAVASIADSLKRIADTLDGTAAGICINETIFAGRQS